MRAAIAALQFEHPKLAVQAMFPISEDFASRLERAIERSGKAVNGEGAKVVNETPKMIEKARQFSAEGIGYLSPLAPVLNPLRVLGLGADLGAVCSPRGWRC